MIIEILNANLFEPAGLHDAGDTGRIIAVTLIDLHLEHRLGMARINTDHRQAKPPETRSTAMCSSVLSSRPTRIFDLTNAAIASGAESTTPSRTTEARPAHHTDRCLLQRTSSPT